MGTENILDKVVEKASTLTDKVAEIKEDLWGEEQNLIIEEFRESSANKVKDILTNINNSGDIFDKSGFKLIGINVSLGIPPDISADFKAVKTISNEEREILLNEVKENNIIRLVIRCLFKANDFYDKIKFGNYNLDTVSIRLGLTPGVDMKFTK